MLMAAEPAALAAVVARLENPSINLAAYGSVAFPLIGILQAPILTLLSLSTTMSKDWDSFVKGRRLMFYLGGGLTVLYLILTFSPLYYWVVQNVISAPPEVVEPARMGMVIGIPWSFAVAYRRFHQGMMIRFDHSRAITVGTLLRFAADAAVLVAGYMIGKLPGASLASLMMSVGTITEAVYVGLRVRPILRNELRPAPPLANPVSIWEMLVFFIPLGMMPLLNQLIRPIGSAALSRMPHPLATLAIWPVIASFSSLIATPGGALNEVVIAMLDRPGARVALLRFTRILMVVQFTVFVVIAFTPLSSWWFSSVSGLEPDLTHLAQSAFMLLIPASLFSPLQSWFSGIILHSRKSRSVTEAMAIYLGVYTAALVFGGAFIPDTVSGIYIAVVGSMLASLCQVFWLWFRSRPALAKLELFSVQNRIPNDF
jgi:hypothetical protein